MRETQRPRELPLHTHEDGQNHRQAITSIGKDVERPNCSPLPRSVCWHSYFGKQLGSFLGREPSICHTTRQFTQENERASRQDFAMTVQSSFYLQKTHPGNKLSVGLCACAVGPCSVARRTAGSRTESTAHPGSTLGAPSPCYSLRPGFRARETPGKPSSTGQVIDLRSSGWLGGRNYTGLPGNWGGLTVWGLLGVHGSHRRGHGVGRLPRAVSKMGREREEGTCPLSGAVGAWGRLS